MALRALRDVSRHTGRYVAARLWNANTARALTVSTARLSSEAAKVTHTGQVRWVHVVQGTRLGYMYKFHGAKAFWLHPQVWEESDYRNIRFIDREKQVCDLLLCYFIIKFSLHGDCLYVLINS